MPQQPIPADIAEKIILFYIGLKYRWMNGQSLKISNELDTVASQLGLSCASAWRLIKFARQIGFVDD